MCLTIDSVGEISDRSPVLLCKSLRRSNCRVASTFPSNIYLYILTDDWPHCLQALEIIPYTLAENSGINPISMVTELRNRHNQGEYAGGINVRNGTICDMWAEKIVQPLLVNTSEIQLATECVGMILKIDDLIPVR